MYRVRTDAHRSHVWYRGEAPQPETERRTATRWLLIRSYCTLRATKVALDCLYCLLQRRRPNGAGAALFRPKGLFAFSLLLSLLFRGVSQGACRHQRPCPQRFFAAAKAAMERKGSEFIIFETKARPFG